MIKDLNIGIIDVYFQQGNHMKNYTAEQRLTWVIVNQPEIDFDGNKLKQATDDAFWIRFWHESDYRVLHGSSQDDVINKAIHYCEIKNLISEEYDDVFSITVGKGVNAKTIVFKLPYHIEEVSVMHDAYWAACKNIGVCLHEPRQHETYLTLIVGDEINKEAFLKLEDRNIFVPNALFDSNEFVKLLQSFMMSENESCYLIEMVVPEGIVKYLPSLNKTSYAATNVILGYS